LRTTTVPPRAPGTAPRIERYWDIPRPGAPEERSDAEWLRAEIALAAKRACRREFGIRPVIVPVVV